MRTLIVCALCFWAGTTLLFSRVRWFARPNLIERLRPYVVGAQPGPDSRSLLSVASFRDVVGPIAGTVGNALSRAFGASDELAVRLRRIHSPMDVTSFRIRQLGWSGAALVAVVLAAQALTLPAPAVLLAMVGAPLLAFLIVEQQVIRASQRWQRRLFLELPVVTEQLGMLLSAGFSLGAALNRLSTRGHGASSQDLRRVTARIQQGLSEVDALREWAELADVDELERLVGVLALNREARDLGRLISEDARSTRREVQRRTLETIERRGQQVWIPVTVATLLPGVLFMAVPFIEAMRLFTGG